MSVQSGRTRFTRVVRPGRKRTEDWAILGISAPGSKRVALADGDDRLAARVVATPQGSTLLAALADGAGSAPLAALGASLACHHGLQQLARALQRGILTSSDGRVYDELIVIIDQIRTALQNRAQRLRRPVRDLATTLVLVLASPTATWVAQVGDSCAVLRHGDLARIAFWPHQGQYVNSTAFITDSTAPRQIGRFAVTDAVALLSDGLSPVALEHRSQQAFSGFFLPMWQELQHRDAQSLEGPLRALLTGPGVRAASDDDVGLVLALRTRRRTQPE